MSTFAISLIIFGYFTCGAAYCNYLLKRDGKENVHIIGKIIIAALFPFILLVDIIVDFIEL